MKSTAKPCSLDDEPAKLAVVTADGDPFDLGFGHSAIWLDPNKPRAVDLAGEQTIRARANSNPGGS